MPAGHIRVHMFGCNYAKVGSQMEIYTCTVACKHSDQGMGPEKALMRHTQCHAGIEHVSFFFFEKKGDDLLSINQAITCLIGEM